MVVVDGSRLILNLYVKLKDAGVTATKTTLAIYYYRSLTKQTVSKEICGRGNVLLWVNAALPPLLLKRRVIWMKEFGQLTTLLINV